MRHGRRPVTVGSGTDVGQEKPDADLMTATATASGTTTSTAPATSTRPDAAPGARPTWRPAWLNWTRTPWGPPLLGLVVATTDQLTKWWIVQRFANDPWPVQNVLGDVVRLTYSLNTGAAFGLFRDQNGIFAIIALIVVPIILWALSRVGDVPVARLSLGLLLGGTLGNLLDRIRSGAVVDFIDVGLGDARWYTFNVADSAFVVGTALMVGYLLLWGDEEPTRPAPADTPGA